MEQARKIIKIYREAPQRVKQKAPALWPTLRKLKPNL